MIPVLYEKNETRFLNYGLGEIDFTFVDVERERNGIYTFYGEYPADGLLANELIEERQIKSNAGKRTKWQTFVIDRVNRRSKDVIKVYAVHVSQTTATMSLTPEVSVPSGTAFGALNVWKSNLQGNRQFDIWSDIETVGTTIWKAQSVQNARQALGGVKGSILDIWGGEYEFDNNLIRLHKQMGRNTPTTIEYGRNLKSAEVDKQITNTVTSIVPYAVYFEGGDAESGEGGEEVYVWLDEVVVHGPHRNKWAYDRVQPVDFSSEFGYENRPTQERLRSLANSYVTQNDIGVPRTKITLEMVDLANTLDYEDVEIIEEVELCDFLPVYYPSLGITDTQAKISSTRFNALTDEYISVSIGVVGEGFTTSIRNDFQDGLDLLDRKTQAVGNRIPYLINALGQRIWYETPDPNMEHKKGDTWFEKNGLYHRIHIWDGQRWELIIDSEDVDAVDRRIDEVEQQAQELMEDVEASENKAQQAIEDAGLAQVTAETAQGTAEAAQSSADTAKSRADDALSYAQGIVENQGSLLGLDSIRQAITDIENPTSDTWADIISSESGHLYTYNQQRDNQLLSSAKTQTAGQITTALSDYTTTSELDGEVVRLLSTESTQTAGYISNILTDYAKQTDLNGMVTESILQSRNYITASEASQTFVNQTNLDGSVASLLSSETSQTAGSLTAILTDYVAGNIDLSGYVTETILESRNYLTASAAEQTFVKTELLDGEIVSVLSSGTSQTAEYIQDYVIGEDYLSEVIQTSDLIQSEIKRIVPVPTEAEIIALAEATQLDRADIEAMFEDGFLTEEDIQTIADMAGISLEEAQTLIGNILDAEMVQQYETVEGLAELYRLEDRRTLTAGTTFKYTLTTLPFDIESGKEYVVEFEYPTTTYDSYFYLYTGDLTLQITGNHTFQDPDGQIKITFNADENLPAGDELAIAFIDGRGVEQLWVENISFSGMKEMQVPIVSENNGTIANRITQTADAIDIGLFGQEGAISRIYAGEKGLYLKGENIHLDGKVSMEDAFVRTLVSSDITTDTISAVSGTFTNLISTNIDAQSITTETLNALRARIMGAYTYVDISGTGIGINRYDGLRSIELNTGGMDIYRGGGVVAGRVGGANDIAGVYSGIIHIGAERGNAVALSSKVNGTNNNWVRSLWVAGTTGDIKIGPGVKTMLGETGYGFEIKTITISGTTGIAIVRSGMSTNNGIWFGNNEIRIGTNSSWNTIHSYGSASWT